MNIALWAVQVLLAAMFLMAGVMKAFQYERAKATLPWVKDVPRGFVAFIGISELLAGLGLLLPPLTGILPWLTPLAAAGLVVIMVLATIFHAVRNEWWPGVAFNLVVLALTIFVTYGRYVLLPF